MTTYPLCKYSTGTVYTRARRVGWTTFALLHTFWILEYESYVSIIRESSLVTRDIQPTRSYVALLRSRYLYHITAPQYCFTSALCRAPPKRKKQAFRPDLKQRCSIGMAYSIERYTPTGRLQGTSRNLTRSGFSIYTYAIPSYSLPFIHPSNLPCLLAYR